MVRMIRLAAIERRRATISAFAFVCQIAAMPPNRFISIAFEKNAIELR
jgi:hypothetical protein